MKTVTILILTLTTIIICSCENDSEQHFEQDDKMRIKQLFSEWKKQEIINKHYWASDRDYQLYFLFEYGSPEDFIFLYEKNFTDLFLTSHFKAAIVYSTLNQFSNSKAALKRYFKAAFDYRPFDPFLCETLLPLIDKDLINSIDN